MFLQKQEVGSETEYSECKITGVDDSTDAQNQKCEVVHHKHQNKKIKKTSGIYLRIAHE